MANRAGRYFTQVETTNTSGLEALEEVVANPAGYYFNLHSSSNTPGLMSGNLARSELSMVQMKL